MMISTQWRVFGPADDDKGQIRRMPNRALAAAKTGTGSPAAAQPHVTDRVEKTRIVIADDHALVRAGLRLLLESQPDLTVVGEAATAAQTVAVVRELEPDLLLLDVAMPGESGLEALKTLGQHATIKVLLLAAAIDKADIMLGLQRGARGVVLKETATEMLLKSIRAVLKGEYWISHEIVAELVERAGRGAPLAPPPPSPIALTRREREIVAAVAKGCSNRDIADLFAVTEDTVKHHLTNIYNKTGLSNRLELALFALDHHLGKTP